MNVPRYAALAAKLLRQRLTPGQAGVADAEGGLKTIERALGARARRARLRWLGGAAAAVLVGWGLLALPHERGAGAVSIRVSPVGQGAALRVGEKDLPLRAQATISPGQAIATPSGGGASVRLSTGTELELASDSSVRVDSRGPTERFSLSHGRLSVSVATLANGQRFIVDTPDAQVEVRGTRFELNVLGAAEQCGHGKRTRLSVSEGVVEVRSAGIVARVSAGERWPADCTRPVAVATATAPAPVAASPSPATTTVISPPPAPSRVSLEVPLSRQNDLFAGAVALRRSGDVTGALRAYQELISQFPRSPLAQNAMVERMRLLASGSAGRGAEEARRYLARYPKGFAVEEARRLAEAP
jgi:hypothetical protein